MAFDRLWRDNRAIEGLPIRLVIALVVGIASLSVMMTMIDDMEGMGKAEVDVEPTPDVINETNRSVRIAVVGPQGSPVANATVIAKSGSARLSGLKSGTTGMNGTVSVALDPKLGPNQQEGTIQLDVKPPTGDFADRRGNTEILVINST